MVGTDPSRVGAGTSQIPVVIIPIQLNFNLALIRFSPDDAACGDNVSVLTRVSNSPIFQSVSWSTDTGYTGSTQFGDAYQRANFWKYVEGASPNYHVLFGPVTVLPTTAFDVPLDSTLEPNFTCPGHQIGGVSMDFMNQIMQRLIAQNHITPDTLPIFVTYDIKFVPSTGGVFLGFHNVFAGSQTYVLASYTDPNFNPIPQIPNLSTSDISILSHEIAEWIVNPYLRNNLAPPAQAPWGNIGLQQGCSSAIEVGDPLVFNVYPVSTTSFTYHVQELAYFSWFSRDVPSFAVNGNYSSLGFFSSPAPPCF